MKKEELQMPNVLDVELIVLGSILIDKTAIDRIVSDFSVNLFYEKKNRIVADAILILYRENKPIDLLTLFNKIKEQKKDEEVGGVAFISSLTNRVSTASNIEYHIRILQEEALRRNLIEIGTIASSKSLDVTQDVFELFNETQNNLDNALKKVINYEIKNAGSVHDAILLKSIEMLQTGSKSGVPTGLRLLDNVILFEK